MKVTQEPRLPGLSAQLPVRLTDLLREFARAINELISRTDTPLSVKAVTVTASPYTYTATADGFVSIVGGTVSGLAYVRQGVTTALAVGPMVPVKKGDGVRITYSVAPTVTVI